MIFPIKIFVTGTDTGVGKTLVSGMLVAGLKSHYWKPIQSGFEGITDRQWVQSKTGMSDRYFHPEAYLLNQPVSPHASARQDGIEIDLEKIQEPPVEKPDRLIIEGAGGIMVPLNDRHFMLDLMKRIGAPVLLVASSSLGTINHTLLSLEKLRKHGLEVIGVVMNGAKNIINREAIESYGHVDVLAEIEPLPRIDPQSLNKAYNHYFNR